MSSQFLYYFKMLVLPPGGLILLLVLGLFISLRWSRIGKALISIGIVALYALSTPILANQLIKPLETQINDLNLARLNSQAQAIVILTGGNVYAPEYGGEGPTGASLARTEYAVALYRQHPLPILIVGGSVGYAKQAESDILQMMLAQHFNITQIEVETQSGNTYQNAIFLKPILTAQHIQNFYLVDSAWHLPRTLWIFHKIGLNPIAAPTDYYTNIPHPIDSVENWLPNVTALFVSARAFYEYFSLWEYKIRYTHNV